MNCSFSNNNKEPCSPAAAAAAATSVPGLVSESSRLLTVVVPKPVSVPVSGMNISTPTNHHRKPYSDDDSDYEEVNDEMNAIYQRSCEYPSKQQHQQEATSFHSSSNGNNGNNHNTPFLRRTPGANSMYRSAFRQHQLQNQSPKSSTAAASTATSSATSSNDTLTTPLLRRTPGASAMHKSRRQNQTNNSSTKNNNNNNNNNQESINVVVTSGLPFTTPVATNRQSRSNNSKPPLLKPFSTSKKTKSSKKSTSSLYTPAGYALAKNKALNLGTPGNGKFSPHTLQLATNLDNLLDDDDDDDDDDSNNNVVVDNANVNDNKNKNKNVQEEENSNDNDKVIIDNINNSSSDHNVENHNNYAIEVGGCHKELSMILPIQKASSFGTESIISLASSTISYTDEWLDSTNTNNNNSSSSSSSKEFQKSFIFERGGSFIGSGGGGRKTGESGNISTTSSSVGGSKSNERGLLNGSRISGTNNDDHRYQHRRSHSDTTFGSFDIQQQQQQQQNGLMRPKFIQNSFRLDNSYNSEINSSANAMSESPRKSIQSLSATSEGVTSLHNSGCNSSIGVSALSFSKSSPTRRTSVTSTNSKDVGTDTIIHIPTPKKAYQQQQQQQPRSNDESHSTLVHDFKNEQVQQQQHTGFPPVIANQYVETNTGVYEHGYDANDIDMLHHQYSQHHYQQHQGMQQYHHQLPMIPHMEYMNHSTFPPQQHQHFLPSSSPLTIPIQSSMSPLTISTTTYPQGNMHYDCSSPILTANNMNMPWAAIPPSQEQFYQWHSSTGINWDNYSVHQQNHQYNTNLDHKAAAPQHYHHPTYQMSNQAQTGFVSKNDVHHSHQIGHMNQNIPHQQSHFQHGLQQTQRGSRNMDEKMVEKRTNLKGNNHSSFNRRGEAMSELDHIDGKKAGRSKASKKYLQSGNEKNDDSHGKGKKKPTKKKVLSDVNTQTKTKDIKSKPKPVLNSQYTINNEEKKNMSSREEAAELKRSELVETPTIRALFKDFYRQYRIEEKISSDAAAKFLNACLESIDFPSSIHWRLYLELADISKRANDFNNARELFQKVNNMQPYASQGWIESSKLEEECGHVDKCSSILKRGLHFCPTNEHLLIRAIKHEERLAHEQKDGDLCNVRALLAPLKNEEIEKVWKVILEGALIEARAGHIDEARRTLNYLMNYISWYGPLYLEAFRLERDSELPIQALSVVERGLKEIPRYGPLWFGAFRLCEGLDIENEEYHLPRTLKMTERATGCISRELLWKVHLEAAQAQERGAYLAFENDQSINLSKLLSESRKRFAMTVGACPTNLRWKVWLAAGRMELSAGRFEESRKIFLKSYSVVPLKGRPTVLLECARLEEFVGNSQLAKAILCKSRSERGSDWKVWLQSVDLEIRTGNRNNAIKIAANGLKFHSGTGRLWAAFVQLREKESQVVQMNALNQALNSVPKSGEVWCEAARIHLNPLSQFDTETAKRHLEFATKFTPQYGDSFIETLRLEMLQKFLFPSYQTFVSKMKCLLETSLDKRVDFSHYVRQTSSCIREAARIIKNDKSFSNIDKIALDAIDTSKLVLHCSNAYPNYGKLWFYCRRRPSDTARAIMLRAKHMIGHNLGHYGHLYVAAEMRQISIHMLKISGLFKEFIDNFPPLELLLLHEGEFTTDVSGSDETFSEKRDAVLLERNVSSSDFTTGIFEVNKPIDIPSLSSMERRKVLFGSDLLL